MDKNPSKRRKALKRNFLCNRYTEKSKGPIGNKDPDENFTTQAQVCHLSEVNCVCLHCIISVS